MENAAATSESLDGDGHSRRLAPLVSVKADPISDLRSLSVFKDADLNKLAGGDILAATGPAMSLARGLSVQSAYVVRAPLKTTVSLQQQWNPLRHPELKVYAQGDFSGRGSPADFQGLASARSNSSVRAFVDATLKLPQDASKIQLSNAEAKAFVPGGSSDGAMPASVVAFWSKVWRIVLKVLPPEVWALCHPTKQRELLFEWRRKFHVCFVRVATSGLFSVP